MVFERAERLWFPPAGWPLRFMTDRTRSDHVLRESVCRQAGRMRRAMEEEREDMKGLGLCRCQDRTNRDQHVIKTREYRDRERRIPNKQWPASSVNSSIFSRVTFTIFFKFKLATSIFVIFILIPFNLCVTWSNQTPLELIEAFTFVCSSICFFVHSYFQSTGSLVLHWRENAYWQCDWRRSCPLKTPGVGSSKVLKKVSHFAVVCPLAALTIFWLCEYDSDVKSFSSTFFFYFPPFLFNTTCCNTALLPFRACDSVFQREANVALWRDSNGKFCSLTTCPIPFLC